MGQHRAALRAKARRQKNDYWKKMRPFVVFMACFFARIRAARFRRIASLFGGYIRERLQQKSFLEQILLPVVVEQP